LTILDFLSAMKNPIIMDKPFLIGKVLHALIKNLYMSEGVDIDSDDVYR